MVFIIDGNAFLNVVLAVTRNIMTNSGKNEFNYSVHDVITGEPILTHEAKITFRNFSLKYLNSIISPIGKNIKELHFVMDSKSWRNGFINESINHLSNMVDDIYFNDFEYKGTRSSNNIDKSLFFSYFIDEIGKGLKDKCNVHTHIVNGSEGDDLIAYMCEHRPKTNIVIYSVDHDIKQLVEHTKDRYIALLLPKQSAKHRKIYIAEKDDTSSNVTDFFDLDESDFSTSSNINYIVDSYKNKGYNKAIINKREMLIEKIYGGDKSDNIPRVYKMTPGKIKLLTEELLNKYGESLIDVMDSLQDDYLDHVINFISTINKIKDPNIYSCLKDHIIINTKVIRLITDNLPDEIKNNIKNYFESFENSTTDKSFNYSRFIEIKNKPVLL